MGQVKTDALNTTYTTEQYPLGSTFRQDASDVVVEAGNSGVSSTVSFGLLQGDREWVFVQATEVVAAGQLCEWDFDGAIAFAIEPSNADDMPINLLAGVADHAIAAGSYGWIIKRGTCVVLAGASVAAGSPLASHTTDGLADSGGAAGTCLGVGLEADGASLTSYAQAYIAIP